MDLYTMMKDYAGSNDQAKMEQGRDGSWLNVYPSKRVSIPVDINKVRSNGTVNATDSVVPSVNFEISRNNDERQVFLHIGSERFEMIVVQNQKLLLYNSFEYRTKEDFIYYLLFASEQLSLNPEQFRLQFLGNVDKEHELFQIAYKYVRDVSMLDTSAASEVNGRSIEENQKFFSLFQS
ncbi:MAG: DUF3822 family protein [Sphingobacteriales bacterium]|nr:MAG: DUF3822 family protein [Sphingobacteriales bacterium]